MKKFSCILIISLIIFSLCGCGFSREKPNLDDMRRKNDVFSLSFGTSMPEDSYVADAMKKIKAVCEEKSKNCMKFDLYYNNTLGDADIILQTLKNDTTVNIACYNTGDIFDCRFSVNSIPFLLETPEQIKYYYSPGSVFYTNYSSYFEPLGIKLLGIYADGYIGIAFSEYPVGYDSSEIEKSIMVRKGSSDIDSYILDAMHFTSTAVPFDEISRAFYLNSVQGAFGLTAVSADEVLGSTVKYWLPVNVYVDTLDFTIALDSWSSLPEEYQKILQDAVTEICNTQFAEMAAHNEEAVNFLTEDGTIILDLSEDTYEEYKENIKSYSWPKISQKVGDDLFNEIVNDVSSH